MMSRDAVADEVSVAVCEAEFLLREGLVRVLQATEGMRLGGVWERLDHVAAGLDEDAANVLITGLVFPPASAAEGLETLEALLASRPRLGLIVLSDVAKPDIMRAVFARFSGRGYLLYDRLTEEQLRHAVHEVAAGGSYVEPTIVGPLLITEHTAASALRRLSPREHDILALVADGRSNDAIAAATGITIRGVERHINAIFAKLGLNPDGYTNRRVIATRIYRDGSSRLFDEPASRSAR